MLPQYTHHLDDLGKCLILYVSHIPDHPSDECIEVTFTTLKELPPEEVKKKSESGEYNKEYLLKL